MKKLMIMAMAIAMAGITQAASIQWGSEAQNIYNADGSALMAAGEGLVQLIYVSGAYDALTGTYATEVVVDSGLVGDGAALPKKGKYVDSIDYTYGVDTLGTGQTIDNGDMFIMRVYSAPTVAGSTDYWTGGVMTIVATDNSGVDELKLLAPTTTTGEWFPTEPIPEPTSLALLAIGIAAIGLRRKFRK